MRWFWLSAVWLVPLIAASGVAYDEAQVVDVVPIYETVRIATPREVCHVERVRVDARGGRRASVTAPIVGGIIGGAIGNAAAHDTRHRGVATMAGALLGASIARDVAASGRALRSARPLRYRTEEVCEVHDEFREEERLAGYRVTYEYAGELFTMQTVEQPGATVPVRVQVTPV